MSKYRNNVELTTQLVSGGVGFDQYGRQAGLIESNSEDGMEWNNEWRCSVDATAFGNKIERNR